MKKFKLIAVIFTFAGIGFLVGALFSYIHTKNFLAKAVTAQGTVIQLIERRSNDSITYAPSVVFRAQDGKEVHFVSSSSSNPPGFTEGEQVEILYSPDNLQTATINSTGQLWGVTIFLTLFSIPFWGIGSGILLYSRYKNKTSETLKISGKKILADFQGVELNQGISYNGQHPYQITAQWFNEETGQVHLFKSDSIWYNPENYIEQKLIEVYIDPQKPKRYYMDISFLPKLAN